MAPTGIRPLVLAVVPARGGSKGLARKNLRPLGGRPLVAHAVDSGRRATLVDRVICSTDDEEIAEAARAAGAEIPFMRPAELARDETEDWPVFHHALTWLEEHEGWRPDFVVNLRPTSPFRRPSHVDDAIRLLLETGADSVKSVSPARQHPHKMWEPARDDSRILQPFLKTRFRLERGPDVPRAQLPEVLWQNGIVDVTRREVIMGRGVMIGPRVAGLLTSAEDAVDVDGPIDFMLAELLYRERRAEQV